MGAEFEDVAGRKSPILSGRNQHWNHAQLLLELHEHQRQRQPAYAEAGVDRVGQLRLLNFVKSAVSNFAHAGLERTGNRTAADIIYQRRHRRPAAIGMWVASTSTAAMPAVNNISRHHAGGTQNIRRGPRQLALEAGFPLRRHRRGSPPRFVKCSARNAPAPSAGESVSSMLCGRRRRRAEARAGADDSMRIRAGHVAARNAVARCHCGNVQTDRCGGNDAVHLIEYEDGGYKPVDFSSVLKPVGRFENARAGRSCGSTLQLSGSSWWKTLAGVFSCGPLRTVGNEQPVTVRPVFWRQQS